MGRLERAFGALAFAAVVRFGVPRLTERRLAERDFFGLRCLLLGLLLVCFARFPDFFAMKGPRTGIDRRIRGCSQRTLAARSRAMVLPLIIDAALRQPATAIRVMASDRRLRGMPEGAGAPAARCSGEGRDGRDR